MFVCKFISRFKYLSKAFIPFFIGILAACNPGSSDSNDDDELSLQTGLLIGDPEETISENSERDGVVFIAQTVPAIDLVASFNRWVLSLVNSTEFTNNHDNRLIDTQSLAEILWAVYQASNGATRKAIKEAFDTSQIAPLDAGISLLAVGSLFDTRDVLKDSNQLLELIVNPSQATRCLMHGGASEIQQDYSLFLESTDFVFSNLFLKENTQLQSGVSADVSNPLCQQFLDFWYFPLNEELLAQAIILNIENNQRLVSLEIDVNEGPDVLFVTSEEIYPSTPIIKTNILEGEFKQKLSETGEVSLVPFQYLSTFEGRFIENQLLIIKPKHGFFESYKQNLLSELKDIQLTNPQTASVVIPANLAIESTIFSSSYGENNNLERLLGIQLALDEIGADLRNLTVGGYYLSQLQAESFFSLNQSVISSTKSGAKFEYSDKNIFGSGDGVSDFATIAKAWVGSVEFRCNSDLNRLNPFIIALVNSVGAITSYVEVNSLEGEALGEDCAAN